MSPSPRVDTLKVSLSQLIPTAASELVSADGILGSQISTAPPTAEQIYAPGGSVESAAAGTGGALGKAAQSTHQLLCRRPQATEQPTHHLFRGQSVWQGISCFYSLGQRPVSFKEKQSQTIASKLCMRKRERCSLTRQKAMLKSYCSAWI